jgi:ribosomal protein L40E
LIIILILAVVGFYLWNKGNLQIVPKQKSILCDGKSTIPIKVQFVNIFGKPRKQSKDREVEMETTSGKIQNVTIPASKEFAEAALTSSTEGGPVTVTAKSGKQKATTQVNFVCEDAVIDLNISLAEMPADGKSTATVTIKVKDAMGNYVTSSGERTIALTTTLGTITSPVKIPPKSHSGIATITSGQISGTAIVTAVIDQFKGEGKVVFAELPKRYCMHCGATMAMDASSCHKCGKTPPSGVDTTQCSACGAVLPLSAKFCDKCGAKQSV